MRIGHILQNQFPFFYDGTPRVDRVRNFSKLVTIYKIFVREIFVGQSNIRSPLKNKNAVFKSYRAYRAYFPELVPIFSDGTPRVDRARNFPKLVTIYKIFYREIFVDQSNIRSPLENKNTQICAYWFL